jgi:hypothetical protein
MFKVRLVITALLVALIGTLVLAPAQQAAARPAPAQAATTNPLAGIPLTGTLDNGGTFAGTLDVTSFTRQGGALAAVGTLSGTLRDANGNVIGTVADQAVTMPAAIAQATCEILNLNLGPLDLNLLGNLLCAVAHLLDGPSPLSAHVNRLNQIIRLF